MNKIQNRLLRKLREKPTRLPEMVSDSLNAVYEVAGHFGVQPPSQIEILDTNFLVPYQVQNFAFRKYVSLINHDRADEIRKKIEKMKSADDLEGTQISIYFKKWNKEMSDEEAIETSRAAARVWSVALAMQGWSVMPNLTVDDDEGSVRIDVYPPWEGMDD